MICPKCGNFMKEDEIFCSKCGTKAGDGGGFSHTAYGNAANPMTGPSGGFIAAIRQPDGSGMKTVISAALLVLNVLFYITKIFYAGSFGIRMNFSMFQDLGVLAAVYVIGYLISAFVVICPVLFKRKPKLGYFLPGFVMLSLSMLLFIIALIGAAQEKSASGMGSLVEYGLTFTGWLYVMTWIGAVVVSVLTLIGTKKSAPTPASYGTGGGNYGFGL